MTAVKYVIPNALDAELDYIRTNTASVVILTGYVAGDVSSGANTNIVSKTLSSVTSGSIWGANSAGTGSDRNIQVAANLSSAASASGDATQIAFLNASGVPILVSPVTTQNITINNTVNIPRIIYTAGGTLA